MLLNPLPVFHHINSVREEEPGVYLVNIHAEIHGRTVDEDYVSRENDPFGLAPQVWAAVQQWVAEGKPVERG